MSTDEMFQECEEICANPDKTPWEKFEQIIHYYTNSNDNRCPGCNKLLTSDDVKDDFDICAIIADDGEAFYDVHTPCCGKLIYTTDKWNSNLHTETEMWEEARTRYHNEFLAQNEKYQYAKEQYRTICDLIFDKAFLKLS